MRKLTLILLFLSFATVTFAQKRSEKDLLGKWVFKINRDNGMIFKKGNKVVIFKKGEQPSELSYTADFSKTPIKGALILGSGDQTFPLKVQLEFVDAKTIKWTVYKVDLPGSNPAADDKANSTTQIMIRAVE